MRRWLCLILLWITASVEAQGGIPRWDALPAIDVMHLQGPYAGRNVCPICQHGYDAGVLVFLPSTTSPTDAGRIARALQATVARVNDDRFRPFLILTGASPSKALLSAVKSVDSNWYVAHLSSAALPAASRDFRRSLDGQVVGYVFAQRRLLWAFNPDGPGAPWLTTLMNYAAYGMTFLRSTYAHPVVTRDPDTPKGRLWSAPNQLSTKLTFTKVPQQTAARACFSDNTRSRRRDALVALTLPDSLSPKRTWWARTDDAGCLLLHGMQGSLRIHAELFSPLQAVATARIDTINLQPGKDLDIRVASTGGVSATGREHVVGLPCEGCEAVFQGLPARLSASTRLAPTSEPGEPLVLSGTVRNSANIPQPNVVVYAYQTDLGGRYPIGRDLTGAAARHGRLRWWARTDSAGRYTFRTIRPGGYPGESIPQHIHMHIIEPGRCTYYLGDVLFADDPRLTTARRMNERNAYGGSGIVQAEGNKRVGWKATRNVTLGLNVPGYRACST